MFVASREDRWPDLQCIGGKKEQFFAKFLNVMKILFFILTRQFQRYQTLYMWFYKHLHFNALLFVASREYRRRNLRCIGEKRTIFCKVSQCYEYIFFILTRQFERYQTLYICVQKKKKFNISLLFVTYITGISQARFTMYGWGI